MKTKFYQILFFLILPLSCKKDNAPDRRIFAWGDSLTAGLDRRNSYPNYLERLTGVEIVNMGIGGATSTEIARSMLTNKESFKFPAVIWVGRNNFRDTAQVQKDIAQMVDSLKSSRYIILGVINRYKASELIGGVDYKLIVQLNKTLGAKYGEHFIDIRQELINNYDPGDKGDVKCKENDVSPASLRSDNLHLNSLGYKLVAQKVYAKMNLIEVW